MTTAALSDLSPAPDRRTSRDFHLYWLAGGANQLGSQASGIVFPLVALAVSGSPSAAGLVGALALAGRLAAAPAAGVLADRLPRKAMMVTSLLLAAASMGVVLFAVATDVVVIGLLAGAAFAEGIAQAGYEAAGAGAIRRVLPADSQQGLARLEARNHAAQITGPILGGGLYQLGRWIPFLFDVLSYLFAAACVAAIRTDLTPARTERTSFLADLRAGLRFVWWQPFLRFVTIWAAGINFVFGALVYYAILAAGQRETPAVSIGLILTIASAGGLLGALAAPQVLRRIRPMTVILVASWAMAGLVVALSFTRQTWGYGLVFGLVFLLSPLLGIIFQSRVIALTPDALQGRVATVMGTTGELLQLPAPLLAGVLVARYDPGVAPLVFAVGLAGLAAYTTVRLRRIGTAADATDADPHASASADAASHAGADAGAASAGTPDTVEGGRR